MCNIIGETNCQSRFDARYSMLGAGALRRPRGMVWGGRGEVYSVIFEIIPKYYISDSSVDYEGYSIPSKGFLSTVIVNIMII